ncbi:MAG: SLBB domain-containing protein, partial [Gammaproteobacteria bacterium]|nr:SLBB domain-containing protein [Gammaproteobacteria bacterium]
MKHNILTILLFSIISGLLSQSVFAAKDQAELLKTQCENITPQQRQMAKMAGYNLDEICSSIPDMNDLKNGKDASRQNVVPRGTQYQTDDRGVIERDSVEGIMLQGSDKIKMPGSFKTASSGKIKKYGYDLFAGLPTTFAPADDIPVPASYVVGPGDVFQIQLLGKENQQHNLTVNRDGSIHFPELGPIGLSGLSFVDAKKLIEEKIAEQMIGVRAVISMGELRSIRIFVLGEAFKPGSYTVSSLSTMTNALFVSGGVKEIGSLRKIQLKRNGKVVTTLDLYDLLQKGDTRKDVRLLPGDVIYIPPVGATVGIDGEVKRPAIYELKNEKNLSQLIDLAGGYSPEAFPNVSHITRKNKNGFTTVIDVDLSQKSGKNTSLKNGDMVEVSTVLEDFEDVVHLKGNFHRPRAVKWHKQLKLTDVIHSIQDFQQNTDLNTGLIIRREMPLRKISVKHFNLQQVIEKKFDLPLQPLDEIMVFANDNTRLSDLALVNLELKTQTTDGSLSKIVDITGNVRYPGTYPLSDAMDVKTLIALAGGLAEATFLGNAEITRRDVANNDLATVEHFNINLSEELSGNTRFRLSAKDKLAVFVTPEYREQLTIVLSGEVRFPGKYEFRRGETLTQVIDRAGGFTPMAHVKAAVFSRDDLKQ